MLIILVSFNSVPKEPDKRDTNEERHYKLVITAEYHGADKESYLEEVYLLDSAYQCAQVIDRTRWLRANWKITSAMITEVRQ